ncbi:MAG: hypothetical protein HQK49_03870 [Oligoflexia bacterium]|nr:hypothetical protein [Oligoflexia bacterium]
MKNKIIQYQVLKKIPPNKKLMITLDLIYTAKELKRAALKLKYKNESEQEIDNRLKELIRYATT